MDAATITPPAPARTRSGPAVLGHSPGRRARRRTGPRVSPHGAALLGLLAVGLLLRLWGIGQGLPFSYNSDEAQHFVPRAVAFFSHDLNPRYFLNPPAYSYLLHGVFELWFGSGDAVARTYARDPTSVFVVARVVAALCGTGSVALTYAAGARLFSRSAGLIAAAIMTVAFLPVFYSHLALNDVPTLLPVSFSLVGVAGVLSARGRLRDFAVAGIGIGLAAATKYTGGFTLICLLAAVGARGLDGQRSEAIRGLGVALGLALLAFLVANPYALLDPGAFFAGLGSQASLADGADPVKLGSTSGGGIAYYLWTYTWGIGWGPALAALAAIVLLARRRRWALLAVCVPAVVVFILFMGGEQRYFGRWLMPTFPLVALLAGFASLHLIRLLHVRLRVPMALGSALAAVLLLAQGVSADLHNDAVLSRPDTRTLARAWMVAHVPAGARVVIEPVVPDSWASDVGRSLPWTNTGERWWRYATWFSKFDAQGNPLPAGQSRYVAVDQYERTLVPSLITTYRQQGFCWVVVGSLQAGRAFADPRAAPNAIAYYATLAANATLVYHVSPFAPDAHPVPFSFDWSIDYFPRQYRRPGPEVSVYHLTGGRCQA